MKSNQPDLLLTPPTDEEIMAPVRRAMRALHRFNAGLTDRAAFEREHQAFIADTIRVHARKAACERAAQLAADFADLQSGRKSYQLLENKILRSN